MEHIWLILLSIIGFLISYYIWNTTQRKNKKITCVIRDGDCDKVVNSKYGKQFGIDNSVIGIFYYIFIFAVGILHFILPNLFTLNYVIYSLLFITGGTALFSVYLTGIQVFVLKQFCEYCIVANIINVLIFLVILF